MQKILMRIMILVAVVVTTLQLIGCSEAEDETTDTRDKRKKQNIEKYAAVTEYFREAELQLNSLPEFDFGGENVNVLSYDPTFIFPETTDNAYDLAKSYRNILVEEALNVELEEVEIPINKDPLTFISESVEKGEKICDIAIVPRSVIPTLAAYGDLASIKILPFADISKPYFSRSAADSMTLGADTYGLSGSATFTPQSEYCVFYNTKILNDLKLENPEDLMRDGKWTWSKFSEYSELALKDIEENGYFDENDRYGYTLNLSDSEFVNLVIATANLKLIDNTSSSLSLCYNNDTTSSVIDRVHSLLSLESFYGGTKKNNLDSTTLFENGSALFYIDKISCLEKICSMKNDFSVVPLPKFSADSKNYYTATDGSDMVFCLLKTTDNTELSGAVVEAMSAASYKSLVPAFTELCMQYYLRSNSSVITMRELLNNKLYFECAYSLGNLYPEIKRCSIDVIKNSTVKKGVFESGYRAAEKEFNEFVSKSSLNFVK